MIVFCSSEGFTVENGRKFAKNWPEKQEIPMSIFTPPNLRLTPKYRLLEVENVRDDVAGGTGCQIASVGGQSGRIARAERKDRWDEIRFWEKLGQMISYMLQPRARTEFLRP